MAAVDIKMRGWMEKKGSRLSNRWGRRYFELKGRTLLYYASATDTEPKGSYILHAHCKVSDIIVDEHKKKKHFRFRITWPSAGDDEEGEEEGEEEVGGDVVPSSTTLATPRQEKPHASTPTSLQHSASLDGAETPSHESPANSSAATNNKNRVRSLLRRAKSAPSQGKEKEKEKEKHTWWASMFGAGNSNSANSGNYAPLDLACDSGVDAEHWREAIELSLTEYGSSSAGEYHISTSLSRRNAPPPGIRIKEVEEWIKSSKWKVCAVVEGLRIFEQAFGDDAALRSSGGSGTPNVIIEASGSGSGTSSSSSSSSSSSGGGGGGSYTHTPCYRTNIGVNSSPLEVFKAIMSLPAGCRTGNIRQMRVIESIDNNTDVVQIVLDPIYVYPTWTAPRDLCLMRYWKQNADKSYIICYDSTFHHDCPLMPGYVRADLHATYVISPPRGADYDDEVEEALLTYIAQMDPRGWVWRSFGFQHAMLQSFMLHVLDIRDSLDIDRFVRVHFDPSHERKLYAAASASESSKALNQLVENGASMLGSIPPPTLPAEMWAEPDLETFRLRGKTYNQDKQKVLSAPSLFKLVAVDVFEVPEPTRNIAAHPKNRVFLANQRGDSAWCFVMNIMVPGPPFLCFVVYLEGDKKKIEEDTPFGRIARPFFNGNDDEFRNNRFKLIPRVVDGNMVIKMAVKDTPTLLGNKLKQYYYRGDNYFELDVDVGSSSVARQVVGLAIGFSKTIEVDMAMCLQGNEESELPEVVFGGCSA